jgi:phosphotriesterase-related protein
MAGNQGVESMDRRAFLRSLPVLAAAGRATTLAAAPGGEARPGAGEAMTVRGPVPGRALGFTLAHEHALVDFQPYREWARSRVPYDRDEVVEVMLPHLVRIRELGCRTFVDATPPFVGRDVALLRRLSEASGLHILTPTGNYAARDNQHLPPHVFTDSPSALAQRWIDEWEQGIEGTGVRPGFVKLGFNGGPLSDVERRLIRAAAIAHLKTGLTLASHTGPAVSAFEQLAELRSAGVAASAWIWIHAQAEKDLSRHVEAATRGAWISFDGVAPESVAEHVDAVVRMREAGLLQRVLVSQDAGWYHVGEARGGQVRPFDTVFTGVLPALRARGLSQAEIDTLFVDNPARAFSVAVRGAGAEAREGRRSAPPPPL